MILSDMFIPLMLTYLFTESNVQPIPAPVTLVGDLHGQFYDLIEASLYNFI